LIERKQGRPVDPKSEAQREPWKRLGVSRATYYWRKRYGDVPVRPVKAKKKRVRRTWEELVASL
jgi:hypothetical protein